MIIVALLLEFPALIGLIGYKPKHTNVGSRSESREHKDLFEMQIRKPNQGQQTSFGRQSHASKY